MYESVAQPCDGVNINTNGEDKLFRKWSLVKPTDSLIIQHQHKFKSHQHVNTDINGIDKLFAQ